MKRLSFLLLLACSTSFAQGVSHTNVALYNSGGFARVVPSAVITVCNANDPQTPCTTKISIYSNYQLTSALANPFNADANGNYAFFAAPGNYTVTVTGIGITGFSYQISLGTGTPSNLTGPGAITGTFSGNYGTTGNNAHTGIETFVNINNVLYVGNLAGQFATLQAAHDALPSTGGTIEIIPLYADTETTTVNITKNNVSILCRNQTHFLDTNDTRVILNHVLTGFNITGQNFGMDGCHLKIGTITTRVGVPIFDSNTTVGGRLSNLVVTGQSGSPDNGIIFRSTDAIARQGIWQLDNIINRDGFTWTAIIKVSIVSNSLTGAYYKFTDIVNSYSEKYTDAAIVLDGTIDTVEMDRISTGNTQTNGHNIWLRNTVSASGLGFPRWVHCDNCYPEAGGNIGGTILQIDSGRDIDFSGYMASTTNCVNQTGALVGVNIHDIAFTNIFGTCLVITSGTGATIHHNNFSGLQQGAISYTGGGGLIVDGNTFYDSSQQTTNTYDTISVAAGTGTLQISNNSWLNQGTNKPRYGVNFLGNMSNLVLTSNNYAGATFGTSFLNPPANNLNLSIIGQDSTVIGKITETLSTIGHYSNLGTACTNGELTLSANWGNTGAPTVTAVAGIGQTCQWTITAGGAATGASPTITDTLTNALPVATIVCEMHMVGGTGAATLINQTSLSATAPIFTFNGTPGAGLTYIVVRRCGP